MVYKNNYHSLAADSLLSSRSLVFILPLFIALLSSIAFMAYGHSHWTCSQPRCQAVSNKQSISHQRTVLPTAVNSLQPIQTLPLVPVNQSPIEKSVNNSLGSVQAPTQSHINNSISSNQIYGVYSPGEAAVTPLQNGNSDMSVNYHTELQAPHDLRGHNPADF